MSAKRKANTASVAGVLIYPGAGTDSSHPSLVRLEQSLEPLPVRRADFAYRRAGRKAPAKAPVMVEDVRREAADFADSLGSSPAHLVLGGRSMGGRMCSMAVADGLPAAGLMLIAYPLHPPGKPESLRVEHLARLSVPCLFISGTRDPFGSPDELQAWTATIPGPVTHVWCEGKGHDLKGCDGQISDAVKEWLATIVAPAS